MLFRWNPYMLPILSHDKFFKDQITYRNEIIYLILSTELLVKIKNYSLRKILNCNCLTRTWRRDGRRERSEKSSDHSRERVTKSCNSPWLTDLPVPSISAPLRSPPPPSRAPFLSLAMDTSSPPSTATTAPPSSSPSSATVTSAGGDGRSISGEKAQLTELDGWIEQLFECKQLAENNVKTLCEKVGSSYRSRASFAPLNSC